jgi:uncharacterized damage-inducible protein DinB
MISVFVALFERDLNALAEELKAFKNEENLWLSPKEINNSAGNLCLHLCGNLQHFIGATLGNTGYVRDRAYELNADNIPISSLLKEVEQTKNSLKSTLLKIPKNELENEYPIAVFDQKMSTLYFLTHLHGHLTYHLGQISYHRRLLDGVIDV